MSKKRKICYGTIRPETIHAADVEDMVTWFDIDHEHKVIYALETIEHTELTSQMEIELYHYLAFLHSDELSYFLFYVTKAERVGVAQVGPGGLIHSTLKNLHRTRS